MSLEQRFVYFPILLAQFLTPSPHWMLAKNALNKTNTKVYTQTVKDVQMKEKKYK